MYFGTTSDEREPMFSDKRVKALSPVKLRNDLVSAGVLCVHKRNGRGYVALGEDADEFVMKHMGAPLPPKALAAPLLRNVFERIREFLQTQGCSLADFRGNAPVTEPERPATEARMAPEQAIREAYLALTHGEKRRRVRLADLRRKLSVPKDVLDRTLLSMQTAQQVVLYKLDNTAEISPDDEQAALYVSDQPRHLVYLEA
jgi:hypothetical protein